MHPMTWLVLVVVGLAVVWVLWQVVWDYLDGPMW